MAVTTPEPIMKNASAVFQAINYYLNSDSTYFVIGKSTAWDNNDTPPAPTQDSTVLDPIAYIKPACYLCYPTTTTDTASFITYKGQNYDSSYVADAYNNNANYVYYETSITSDDITNLDQFRIFGITMGLTPITGATSTILTPSQVSDTGRLHAIYNSVATIMTDKTTIKLNALISETIAQID